MEMLFHNVTMVLAVVGVLAFIVSVITQVFKGVGGLSKIPFNYGGSFCGVYGLHTPGDYLVYVYSCGFGWIYGCVCGNVRLGEIHGIMETFL